MPKPLALTEDELKKIEHRVIQRWQIHRSDMEALIAMARERNQCMAGLSSLADSAEAAAKFGTAYIGQVFTVNRP